MFPMYAEIQRLTNPFTYLNIKETKNSRLKPLLVDSICRGVCLIVLFGIFCSAIVSGDMGFVADEREGKTRCEDYPAILASRFPESQYSVGIPILMRPLAFPTFRGMTGL